MASRPSRGCCIRTFLRPRAGGCSSRWQDEGAFDGRVTVAREAGAAAVWASTRAATWPAAGPWHAAAGAPGRAALRGGLWHSPHRPRRPRTDDAQPRLRRALPTDVATPGRGDFLFD